MLIKKELLEQIHTIISQSKNKAIHSVNFERVLMNNKIEKLIVKEEPSKSEQADYISNFRNIKYLNFVEFLGLKRETSYYEKDLETAIIDHLQEFLLELGNGFSFVARQKRIHLEGDDFFIDLVFYNRLIQSFVIIEMKTTKLTHEDIGQLQMYVNYYDRYEKQEFENPTIGILLCADKNDAVVKITLPKRQQNYFCKQIPTLFANRTTIN